MWHEHVLYRPSNKEKEEKEETTAQGEFRKGQRDESLKHCITDFALSWRTK